MCKIQIFWTWRCYLPNNTHETGFSLTHLFSEFRDYSRRGLHHVAFISLFCFLVCFNRSLHVHSILRHQLHLAFRSLQSGRHWNPVQCVCTWALKNSRSPPSFGIRGRTWSAKAGFSLCIQIFLVFHQFLRNCIISWLNDSMIPLLKL